MKMCNSTRITAARRKKNKRRYEQKYPIPYAAIRQRRIMWRQLKERYLLEDEYAAA